MAAFKFISGDDDFLVSNQGRAYYDEKTKDITDDFSREIIQGAAQNVGDVHAILNNFRQAIQTLSLFGEKKVVWLKNVNFLGDTVTGRAEGTKQAVEALQEALQPIDPDSVDILITAFPVDRRRKEFKWFQKHAQQAQDFKGGEGSIEMLAALIQEETQALNTTLDARAAEILIAKVGGNTRLALEEVRKLSAYLGPEGGIITEHLINELVPNFGDSDFFESVEAFYALDLNWTLDALRRHFFNNTDSRGIIQSLQNRNRIMIQLRVLLDGGALTLGARGFSKASFEQAAQVYANHFGGLSEKSAYHIFTQNLWYLGNKIAPTTKKINLKKLIDLQMNFFEAFQNILAKPTAQETVMRDLAIKSLSQ